MLFHTEYSPETAVYHDVFSARLRAPFDAARLSRAVERALARHPVLRTSFDLSSFGEPLQLVHGEVEAPFEVEDLRGVPEGERVESLAAWLEAERHRGFAWSRPPLVRFHVHRLDEDVFQLTLSFHHSVLDGWSAASLLAELFRGYVSEEPLDEEPPPAAFREFVRLEQMALSSPETRGFWHERLAGAEPSRLPRWPVARGENPAGQARDVVVAVPGETLDGLRAVSRAVGVPLKSVLLAAHLKVLSRWTGRREVITGLVANGRPETEGSDRALGLFLNTLPFRAWLGAESWAGLVRATFEAEREMLPHRRFPLAELQAERDGGPLFDTVFNFVHFHVYQAVQEAPGVELLDWYGYEETDFPLGPSFQLDPSGTRLDLRLSYQDTEIDSRQAETMAGTYARTLAAMAAAPDVLHEEASLLSEAELRQLDAWGDGGSVPGTEIPVHRLFESRAADAPDRIALVDGDTCLSYGELNNRANRAALWLRAQGAGPEARVGISLGPSIERIVLFLAVLKAGGAYVPLGLDDPQERLARMVEQAGVEIIVTEERWKGGPGSAGVPPALDGGEGLAYVMFTSGSTGVPKAVAIEHRGVVRLVRGRFRSEEVILQLSPITFDGSTAEIWGMLLNGGRLVLGPGGALSVDELGRLLERYAITTLWPSTGLFHQVAAHGIGILRDLTEVLPGGDVLAPEAANRLLAEMPASCVLVNGYGPTENTTHTTTFTVGEPIPAGTPVPIGRPIPGTTVQVLDKAFQPVPPGVPGELLTGGDGLARGYLGRPDLTAERFVPDVSGAFRGEPGARLYRTGDRVLWLPDGNLRFVGRIDRQVKIRGFRIEPGEVEAALSGCPGLREAVVGVREDLPGGRGLVAYVLPREPERPAEVAARVRDWLAARLPEYMLPAAIRVLPEMPLTANGKPDRQVLARLDLEPERAEQGTTTPRDPVEEMLAAVWTEVLGIERPGVESDFFELGGHSLLAIQAVSRVRSVFGVEIPLRWLFEEPTIAGLAERIGGLLRAEPARQAPPIMPREVDDSADLPLSFAQERLWFLEQLQPGTSTYNMPMVVRLTGSLDAAALGRSLDAVVARHESLRTRFPTIEGHPVQVIDPPRSGTLPQVDLETLPAGPQEKEADRLTREEAERPFDLVDGPLLRAALLRLSETEHLALLTMHHVISDGWSMDILIRELASLYRRAPLPDLPIQYADFALWQREWLQGEVLEEHLRFWRERLADAPAVLDLPLDRPRPAVQSFEGDARPVVLNAELTAALQAFGRRAGSTLFMTLLAAFDALLHRLTGGNDVVVGVPSANRNRAEIEGLIGFFVNSLVLRVPVSTGLSVLELIGRVRETALSAFAHQDLPFEKLVAELRPERALSHTPLFQVLFQVLDMPAASAFVVDLPGLVLQIPEVESRTAKFDMVLSFEAGEDGLSGEWRYNTALFDGTTVQRLAGQLQMLLRGLLSDPGCPLTDLPLLTDAERHQALLEWNDQTARLPDVCFPELFARQAERTPGAVAVACEGRTLTYAELTRSVGSAARRLIARGVGPETVVGILGERSPEYLIALLAILEAGGVYLPLDPAHPPRRREQILAQSGARWVIDPSPPGPLSHPHSLPPGEGEAERIDLEQLLAADDDGSPLPVRLLPENLAYVIFTSGSTGVPKGAMLTHCGLLNHLRARIASLGLTEADAVAQTAPQIFDISIWQSLAALLVGGRVQIVRTEVVRDPASLLEEVDHQRITVLEVVPSLLGGMLQAFDESRPRLGALRWLIATGEALPPDLARRWHWIYPDIPLVDAYGPTECTDRVSQHLLRTPPEASAVVTPIGRPLANIRLHVLEAALRPLPIGAAGELFIGGTGVGRGYLGDPARTAEAFVPDPFAAGARLYRTGDLARHLPDGELEFLGRRDHQVKIRGFRIEVGEVAAVLAEHPAVRQCVVLARPRGDGGLALVAYVVPSPHPLSPSPISLPPPAGRGGTHPERLCLDSPPSPHLRPPSPGDGVGGRWERGAGGEVQTFLRHRLPDYMLPAAFVELEALPLTASGKIDRRALPNPFAGIEADTKERTAPRTPLEELIAELWREALGPVPFGVEDNFFALGGDSIKGAVLIHRLRRRLGETLHVTALFDAPTVAGLAAWLEARHPATAGRLEPIQKSTPEAGPAPLSFSQERIWFLQQLEIDGAAYNMPTAFRLRGSLDVVALDRVLCEIARRHETLRTRFPVRDGQPLQVVEPAPASLLVTVDLAALPADVREDEARRVMEEEALRPFDLERGALVRALLVRLGANESAALFVTHHIACDGWSMGLWAHEIAALYRGEMLPDPPVQYADFARWQRGWLAGETLESQVGYWRERLRGLPPVLDLPADRPRPPVQTFHGASELRLLPPNLVDRLRRIGQQERASLFMVLLAAFQILLSRLSGQEDLAVGSPIAGRTQPEVEGLIGCFLNTLVLRADLSGRPAFPELVRRVRETALGAYAHQDVPFEKLLEKLRPERDLSRPSLFQVLFNMLNAPATRLDLPGLAIEPYEPGGVLAKFDLTLYLAERGDGLILNLVYNTDLFDRVRMEELLRQYAGLVVQIAERPEASIEAYSLLTAEAQAVLPDPQVLLDPLWMGAVHDLFAEQARRHPQRIAVTEPRGDWTYGDLAEAVDQLAGRLHAEGIGKGDRVAVYAHRSSGLVLALLGILRSGAAFGILDPVYPPARLVDILRLARPRAVLHIEAAGPLPAEVEEYVAGEGVFRMGTGGAPARPGLTPGATQFRPPGSRILSSQEPGGRHSVAQGVNPGRGLAGPLTGPHDIAAVAFTSGSTGVPKGILQTHGSMSHFIPWHQDVLGYGESDRFTMLSGLAHDPLQRDVFYSLSIGATLCIPDPDRIGEPGYLADWMRCERITVTHLTPAMAQLLTEGEGEVLPDLRCAVLAGDILTRRDVARVRRLAPQAICVNVYGATESQRALSYHLVEEGSLDGEGEARERQILPLGRGKRDVQLLVLSRSVGLAGIGEIGEIAIRSPHLAHGYLDDPEQTGRKFVANPFTGDPADRVYLTGDLGRYLPDGEVAAAGRADQQIKVRGYRVEPGEIEAELGRLPGVRESVVVGRDASSGKKRVVAFVVLDPVLPPALDELRERLRERLPAYMVPSVFVPLDRLPLNPNGKVDRRALPDLLPVVERAALRMPPRDGLEMRLACIWEEVLETAPVGVTDNFFDLGGHSLLAVRLTARIAHELGRTLPLATLFQAPTVEDLARLLRRERTEGEESPLVRIQDGGARPPLFLVHPAGGQVLCYFDLARALGPEQPVWGLQDVAPTVEPRSLAGLAAEYLRHVQTVQPAGPYLLAGWSFGGRVAFEMARQLKEDGEEVGFLGMIDTGLVEPPGRLGASDADLLIEALGDFPADRDELRRAADPVAALVEQAKRRGDLPPDWSPDNARRLLALFKAHLEVARTDRPPSYPGRVTFFAAEEQPDGLSDPSHGWAALASEIEVVSVPGNHVTAIEDPENVHVLAQRLREAIAAATKRNEPRVV